MKRDGACNSLWQDSTDDAMLSSQIPAGRNFDVIIAGAGITGITTGLQLQKAGKSVLICESQTMGFGTTGGTTAHLNTFLDTPYGVIQNKFGEKDAQLVARSIRQALELIKSNVQTYQVDCGYAELPAYLFSQDDKQSKDLEDIIKAAHECNVHASWDEKIPIPVEFQKVVKFGGQATFHPTRYLAALARAFENAGGVLLENCRITAVDEGEESHTVTTAFGEFRTRYFIYATHVPPGVNLLHFRCAPYRSYAMAVKLQNESQYPDALVYDMYDPYHYYRTQVIDGEKYLIVGGEDHKTGHQENTEDCFRKLEAHIRKYFSVSEIVNKWSSQYYEPTDGLPYIGHLPGHPGTMYVATGYGGNGMVLSNVAALTLTDMIVSGESEYEELYDPNRIKLVAGFSNFMKEAADVVGKLIEKVLPTDKLDELADMANGEARVVKYEGHRLAIYKDENGTVHALNSACTHIKCEVAWNNAERSWDCPCHGSRFSVTGEVLTAPARKDLEKIPVETLQKA